VRKLERDQVLVDCACYSSRGSASPDLQVGDKSVMGRVCREAVLYFMLLGAGRASSPSLSGVEAAG